MLVINNIKVVYDSVERSLAMMTSLNDSTTKSEIEMQKLIQVVEDNRARISDCSKAVLKQ
jgi:transcriptional regulator